MQKSAQARKNRIISTMSGQFQLGFDKGGKIMEKKKIRCICFLLASICFFIVSIVNFMDKNTTPAIPYLLLGISFLVLSTTNLRKNK